MKSNVRTRFAPSPTGSMHIGNLRTALYAYLFARHYNGTFVLRIEDTDQKRYVEGSIDIIYRTLKLAGLNHNEGPDKGGKYGPYVQSERKDIYQKYAIELIEKGHAYYCFCKKKDEEEKDENENENEQQFGHHCNCGLLTKQETEKNISAGMPYVIRQRIPKTGETTFHDEVFGDITTQNNTLDDQVLIKSDGMPTYNFANVIDDHLMEISHIIRGHEYIQSSPKYQLLYDAFGWVSPKTVHLSIINGRNEDGSVSKLSKRHGSVSFDDLVKQGFLPGAILNYTALLGWSPKQEREIFSIQELTELFTIEGIVKTDAIFDYKKLGWMNSIYIKNMTIENFSNYAKDYLKDAPEFVKREQELALKLAQSRINKFDEIKTLFDFLVSYKDFDLTLLENQKNKTTKESSLTVLKDLIKEFENLTNFNVDNLNAIAEKYALEKELKLGAVMWPLRIAVTGETVTPGGMGEMMQLLGKQESIKRLNLTISRLK